MYEYERFFDQSWLHACVSTGFLQKSTIETGGPFFGDWLRSRIFVARSCASSVRSACGSMLVDFGSDLCVPVRCRVSGSP